MLVCTADLFSTGTLLVGILVSSTLGTGGKTTGTHVFPASCLGMIHQYSLARQICIDVSRLTWLD